MRKLALVLGVLSAFVFVTNCKRNSSKLNSGLGLQAGTRLKGIAGAPTFVAISQWFDKFKTNATGQRRAGQYSISASTVKAHTSTAGLAGLNAYVDKELARVKEFRAAVASKDKAKIKTLLERESREIYDIIMVMLRPKEYNPQYGDLFAKFIKDNVTNNGSGFLDSYAQDFLGNMVSKEIGGFSVVANDLESERVEFQKALEKDYLEKDGGLQRLESDLAATETSFNALKNAINNKNTQASFEVGGAPAAFMHYSAAVYSAKYPVSGVGPNGNGPSQKLLDEEPNANDGKGGGGGGGGGDSGCPDGLKFIHCSDGSQLCAPPGMQCDAPEGGGQQAQAELRSLSVSTNWYQNQSSKPTGPAAKQNFDCSKLKVQSAEGRILCERYGSYANVSPDFNNAIESADLSAALQKYAGKTVSFIMAENETAAQDQGQEGACTAYGMTHTVEAVINKTLGGSAFTTPADALWQTYKEPAMQAAYDAAEKFNFKGSNGKTAKVTAVKAAHSITELLTMLSEGPVWAGSEVNASWSDAGHGGTTTLACQGEILGGHSYSLHGFKVNKEGTDGVLYVKNSWGPKFADNGFARLPLKCLTSMGKMPMVAYQVFASAN